MGQHGCVCAMDKLPVENVARGRRAGKNSPEHLHPHETSEGCQGTRAGRIHTNVYLQIHSGNFLCVSHSHKVLCFRDEMDRTDDLWKRLSLIVIHTYKSDMCLETHHRLFSLAECPGKKHSTLTRREFMAGRRKVGLQLGQPGFFLR